MKKIVLCLLILALAVLVTPQSQASKRCIRFPGFCDEIQFDDIEVGGQYGFVTWGYWDWQCRGISGATNIIGRGGSQLVFGTRPVAKSNGVPSDFSFMFVLTRSNRQFDLYKTSGKRFAQSRVNENWTLKQGSCPFSRTRAQKPRLVDEQ